MEGITDAIIDRYVHAQISRRDFNLPLQFWIMRNAGWEGNLVLKKKYRKSSSFVALSQD